MSTNTNAIGIRHGAAPYQIVTVHGGPGSLGDMVWIARRVARDRSVVEAFQRQDTVDGQLAELRAAVEQLANPPVTLIGFSWGAWLATMFTAGNQMLVGKLILIGSGPFDATYAEQIEPTRMSRLQPAERVEYQQCIQALREGRGRDETAHCYKRLGELARKSDHVDPMTDIEIAASLELMPLEQEHQRARPVVPCFDALQQGLALRRRGVLVDAAERITCPIVAIHGADDPHPASGVHEPLDDGVRGFSLLKLPDCGHEPWRERSAARRFWETLNPALGID